MSENCRKTALSRTARRWIFTTCANSSSRILRAEVYDTQWEYRRNMLSRWNVHNEQVLRMMKKAVSFRPIVDIQQFITENICDYSG